MELHLAYITELANGDDGFYGIFYCFYGFYGFGVWGFFCYEYTEYIHHQMVRQEMLKRGRRLRRRERERQGQQQRQAGGGPVADGCQGHQGVHNNQQQAGAAGQRHR